MGRRLAGYVPIHNPDGTTSWYGPGDDVPEDVAEQIGDHAYEDDDVAADEVSDDKPKRAPAKRAAAKSDK